MEPLLGREGALELHRALLADALARQDRLREVAEQILYLSEAGEVPGVGWLRVQAGADLGERMATAFAECFDDGFRAVVVVGIDSPTLPDVVIADAFRSLAEADCVLGPCDDGGYYLLGLSRKAPELFEGVDWGTERVLEQTRARARDAGLRTVELPVWFDIDLPDDLARLEAAGEGPDPARHSRSFAAGVPAR